MRLCLDEHYSPRIAGVLHERGHDVIAAQAVAAFRGLSDGELLERCVGEGRALLSENAADFMALVHDRAARAEGHSGMIFSSPVSMPRGAASIGRFVQALDRLLRDHPSDDALRDQVRWLRPPS